MFSRAMVFRCARTTRVGDERGEARRRLDAVLDVVQRRGAHLEPVLVAPRTTR